MAKHLPFSRKTTTSVKKKYAHTDTEPIRAKKKEPVIWAHINHTFRSPRCPKSVICSEAQLCECFPFIISYCSKTERFPLFCLVIGNFTTQISFFLENTELYWSHKLNLVYAYMMCMLFFLETYEFLVLSREKQHVRHLLYRSVVAPHRDADA
jgi:hypothetical protein